MAGTLKTKLSFDYDGPSVQESKNFGAIEVEAIAPGFYHGLQYVGTSEEALARGDAGVLARYFIKNLDDTNYVSVRPGTGVADLIRIDPGEVAVFRTAASAPFVIADTAEVRIEVWAIDA